MEEEKERKKRCRKPVSRLSNEIQPETGHRNKKMKVSDSEVTEAAIAATLDFQLGEEVFLKGRIADNEGFKGEILSINSIDEKGIYTLAMANPCHGLWGKSIFRPASKMKKLARRVQFSSEENEEPLPALIPIEFSLECAVLDNRTCSKEIADHNDSIKDALHGWSLADSWSDDIWTIDADLLGELWKSHKINYSIFFSLLKDVVECHFTPKTDAHFDAFFILPPRGGSVQFLQEYIQACEQKQEKFSLTFEYVWIFMDKSKDL